MERPNLKNKKRQSKGITLIALIVTIIVLVILAGITISMLIGNNGILTQAARAKEDTEEVQIREELQLAINGLAITYYHENVGAETFVEYIFSDATGKGQDKLKAELGASNLSFDVQNHRITYKGRLFDIEDDGTVLKNDNNNNDNNDNNGDDVETGNNPVGVCGIDFEHEWEDGVCKKCHANCDHSQWNYCSPEGGSGPYDSICSICGKVCTHSWDHGHCDICGSDCFYGTHICGYICEYCGSYFDHEWAPYDDEYHECSICGQWEDHNWSNGECTICHYRCEHPYIDEDTHECNYCHQIIN